MSASRLTWLVAVGGALWTWSLASWSGVSFTTSLLRAITVFVMLVSVMVVFQAVLTYFAGAQQSVNDRPAPAEPAAQQEETPQEREAA